MKINTYRRKQIEFVRRELKNTRFVFADIRNLPNRRKIKKIQQCLRISSQMFDRYERDMKLLKHNNNNLAHAVQNEKEHSKVLLHDKIAAESSYHELLKENIILKEDLRNLEQIIVNYDEEVKNSMIPNLVKLSDDITKFKLKNNVLRKKIENKGNNDGLFPKNSWFGGINFGTNLNQPVSAVNPMIKGCIIQKPTINVRRISFPHENKTSLFANVAISSPIMEEPEENLEINHNVNRKCKNGLRHMINLSNRQVNQTSDQSVPLTDINYCNDSQNTGDDLDSMIDPVVRLRDVSRLLQNSSLRISETQKDSSKKSYASPIRNHHSPEVVLTRIVPSHHGNNNNHIAEDPLEGCSWMYQSASNFNECNQFTGNALQEHALEETDTTEFTYRPKISNSLTKTEGSETALPSSTLNCVTSRPTKKFFSIPLENSDLISNGNNNIINDAKEIDIENNEVQCRRISLDTNICNNGIDPPGISLVRLQNCTTRQKRGRPSIKKNCRRLTESDVYFREINQEESDDAPTESSEQEFLCNSMNSSGRQKSSSECNVLDTNLHLPNGVCSTETELCNAQLDRSTRLRRKCSKSEESAHKKSKNKIKKMLPVEIGNSDTTASRRISTDKNEILLDARKVRKSRSVDSVLHHAMNESNISSNESSFDCEGNNRRMRSVRNKQNISYKEPTLLCKLRRDK